MNIGIDIDGVIFDSETYFRSFAEIYDIESGINAGIANKREVRVQRRYDWTPEQFATYVQDVMIPLERNIPFMAGALKVIDELKNYDIIVGKIADDATNFTILAYMAGTYGDVGSKEADKLCISRLLPEKLEGQYCFRTTEALSCLTFVESEEICKN